MNERGPTTSFDAGAMKRSARSVASIQDSTVRRNENTITLTPIAIATAAARAAIVTELRTSARPRLPAARCASIGFRTAREAEALKRKAMLGTISENPIKTKNAAPNPIHAGPLVRAMIENAILSARETAPARNHAGERFTDC